MSSALDSLEGLAKSAVVVFVASVIARALGLLGEVLVIRSLTPTAFGIVALAYTAVFTLSRLGLLGIPGAVARLMAAEDRVADQRAVLRSSYAIALGSGATLAVAVYLFRGAVAALMETARLSGLLVLFLPFLVAYPAARVSIAALRSRKQSTLAVVARDLGPRTASLGFFVVFVVFGRPFVGAVAYWVALPVVSVTLAASFLHRELPLGSLIDRRTDGWKVREVWSFSWPLAVGSSLVILMSNLDVLMVGYFLRSDAVGFYRSIQPLRQVTQFVLQSFRFLFLPMATEFYATGKLDELRQFYTVSSKWVAILTLPFVLVFSLFAGDVTRVFFGPEYTPAATALAVLTAGLFFNALVGPNGAMVKAIDSPRTEMYGAFAGVAVNVALNVLLIPRFGIVGAALATVAGFVVYNALEVASIYRATGAHPFSRHSFKPIVVTTGIAVALAWYAGRFDMSLPMLLGVGVTLTGVQGFAVLVTGSLQETDVELMRRARRQIIGE